MKHQLNIHAHRNNDRTRDLAILDLMHLQQLGLAPGSASVALLRNLWGISQPQVSRRMAAIDALGMYHIENRWGRYLLIELTEHKHRRYIDTRTRRQRWNAVRQQLEDVVDESSSVKM